MATTIILPTLNESENLKTLIPLLKRYTNHIILADDGIDKETEEIADKYNITLNRGNKRGLTGSVLEAMHLVRTENIIVMDADFQHSPEIVPKLMKGLKNNDVVIASRKELPEEWGKFRTIISKTANKLANSSLNKKLIDPMSGYFGIKTKFIDDLNLGIFYEYDNGRFQMKGFKVLFEILKYLPENVKIKEIYYKFNLRNKGQSKLSIRHIYYFLKSIKQVVLNIFLFIGFIALLIYFIYAQKFGYTLYMIAGIIGVLSLGKILKLKQIQNTIVMAFFYIGFFSVYFGWYYNNLWVDKLQHFAVPLFFSYIIYNIIKPKKLLDYLIIIFIIVGGSAIFEMWEYIGDKIINSSLQGVYDTNRNPLQGTLDDTMWDMIFAFFGALTFVLIKYFKQKNETFKY